MFKIALTKQFMFLSRYSGVTLQILPSSLFLVGLIQFSSQLENDGHVSQVVSIESIDNPEVNAIICLHL